VDRKPIDKLDRISLTRRAQDIGRLAIVPEP
jgi:hypothetical protein